MRKVRPRELPIHLLQGPERQAYLKILASQARKKAEYPMPLIVILHIAILHEARRLSNVSERLEQLAQEQTLISETLATTSLPKTQL